MVEPMSGEVHGGESAVPAEYHWTELSWRIDGDPHPLWGHVGEMPDGRLLVPSWSRKKAAQKGCKGWWDRPLNLRRPTHWLPYLRSRRSHMLAWLEEC